MKLSISLPDEDVELLDAYVRTAGLPSRSAAVRHAVRMLRLPDLEQDYDAAWQEWEASDDGAAWAAVSGDGIDRAAR